MAGLARLDIQKKIAAIQNPPINRLPSDVLANVFSFFSPQERLKIKPVCKMWRAVGNNYWINLLIDVAAVEREKINDLVNPHGVHQRFMEMKKRISTFIGNDFSCWKNISSITLLYALDSIEGIRQHFKLSRGDMWPFRLATASLTGYLPFVEYLIATRQLVPDKETLDAAAKSGSLSLVKYLIETYELEPDDKTVSWAARSGNLCLVQYLIETHGLVPNPVDGIVDVAAVSGNLPLVKYLIEIYHSVPDEETLYNAATSGSLTLVQYLIETHDLAEELPGDMLDGAARSGNLPLVEYLIETHELTPSYGTLFAAASSGNLLLVQYLIATHHLTPDQNILVGAARSGSLPLVKYLIETCHLLVHEGLLDSSVTSISMQHYLRSVMVTTHEKPEISEAPEMKRPKV